MQADAHSLRNELDGAKLQHLRLQEEAAAARAAAQAAQQQLEAQREGEGVLQVGGCLAALACQHMAGCWGGCLCRGFTVGMERHACPLPLPVLPPDASMLPFLSHSRLAPLPWDAG